MLAGDEGFECGDIFASVLGSEVRDAMLGVHRLHVATMHLKPFFDRLPMNAELGFEKTAGDTPLVRECSAGSVIPLADRLKDACCPCLCACGNATLRLTGRLAGVVTVCLVSLVIGGVLVGVSHNSSSRCSGVGWRWCCDRFLPIAIV